MLLNFFTRIVIAAIIEMHNDTSNMEVFLLSYPMLSPLCILCINYSVCKAFKVSTWK
jgi:hypothetical protein